ncbi:hypothetical protein HK105_206846 [Polyrhizophydium stewartii]|uniref:Rab3-GAP regulatory subunit N-terminal domain-containing protein n=1 Tax=Polyrhizophydium stewartii TaxID=2732419 RepID=A0ABR4N2D9_9FUNG
MAQPDDKVAAMASSQSPGSIVPYMISMSYDGSTIVCAARRRFAVFAAKSEGNRHDYEQVGQGSGCEDFSEFITACLCIPLYVPSKSGKSQMSLAIAMGYNTGYLRVFDKAGGLLISQQLHLSSVRSIKLRSVQSFDSQEADEITVCYSDRHAVSIDGTSFWVAARVGQNSAESADIFRSDSPSLTYRKWVFQSQEQITDIISCGPAPNSTFFAPQFNNLTGSYTPLNYTARYVAVGRPMVALYATTETSRSFFAGIVSNNVTTAVTSAVFSFAKSLWNAPPSNSQPPIPRGDNQRLTMPPTPVPSVLVLADPNRNVNSIVSAPPSPFSPRSSLAAMCDSLGRILVIDTNEGQIVRMFKGMREAQIGWIQVADASAKGPRPVLLVLAIYSPRGVLELHLMRHGQRISISNVGVGMRLVQSAPGVLGGMYWRLNDPSSLGPLSQCFLISPTGDIRRIVVPFEWLSGIISTSGHTGTLAQLVDKFEASHASLDDAAKGALLKQIQDKIQALDNSSQKLNALSSLSDAIPAAVHLTMLEAVAATLGLEPSVQIDSLASLVSNTKQQQQQSQDAKNSIDAVVRIHCLRQYQHLVSVQVQDSMAMTATIDPATAAISKLLAQALAPILPTLESEPAVPAATPSAAIPGPRSFAQSFTLNRRWTPGSSNAHTAPLRLADDLDAAALGALVRILVAPFVGDLQGFKDAVRKMRIGSSDWVVLLTRFMKDTSFVDLARQDRAHLDSLAHMLAHVIQGGVAPDRRAMLLMLEFAWSTTQLGYIILVSTVASHVLAQHADLPDLRDAVSLHADIDKMLGSLQFFALGQRACMSRHLHSPKTERTCIERLVADVQMQRSDAAKLGADESHAGLMATIKSLGIPCKESALVYLIFAYADRWTQQSDVDGLRLAITLAQFVTPASLQQAILLVLFTQCVSTKLFNLIDVVEKARRMPKDQISKALTESSPVATAQRFLAACMSLLEMLEAAEPVQIGQMKTQVRAAAFGAQESTLQMEREWLDGVFGMVLSSLSESPDHASLSRAVLLRHTLIVRIVSSVFAHDIKPGGDFGAADGPSADDIASQDPKISAERVAFVAKLADVDLSLARLIAGAFGIQPERIG